MEERMTAVTPKQLAASALTLLLMAAETITVTRRPADSDTTVMLEQVSAAASSLETGQTTAHTVGLEKGRQYHLATACGTGCTVRLQLFSPAGREIDRHVGSRGTPEVAVIPSITGRYRAQVTMARCAIPRCPYTLAVFVR